MNREPGIDRLKAVAVVCVCLIHTVDPWALRADRVAQVLPIFTEWAVPAFFFAGGYVRARTGPYRRGEWLRWIERLLPTYLVASALALLIRWLAYGEVFGLAQISTLLAIGSAWGIYFFVPLFLGALLFSQVPARFPRTLSLLTALFVIALVVTRIHLGKDPLGRLYGAEGIQRSPLFWWGYFLAGWFVKLRIEGRVSPERLALIGTSVALAALVARWNADYGVLHATSRVAGALGVSVALTFASTRPLHRATEYLARYSYEVYLFHYFAIVMAWVAGYTANKPVTVVAVWATSIVVGIVAGVPVSAATHSALRRLGVAR